MKIAMDISYTGKMQASTWQGDSKDFASSSKLFELANNLPKAWVGRKKDLGRRCQME